MKTNQTTAIVLLAVIISFWVSPILVEGQALPSSPGPAAGMTGVGFMPTVPTSNPNLEAKETGINIFGVKIPIAWDTLAITIAKKTIERMVDSTVEWINSGFDGNPAYVSNPEQYFADLADGIAGDYILGSDLAFLCSPFQANIRISLAQQYYKAQPFQCTLTDVVGNIEGFLDDFSQGGWDAWFVMTQNSSNNPYGAYLEAKVELDSRILAAVNLKREQLDWGRGFLSYEKCEALTVPATLSQSGQEECVDASGNLVPKRIITPGAAIEGQLQNTLGTSLRQLELADEFDELIGALLGQLLQRTVFSAQGLFKTNHRVVSTGANNNSPGAGEDSCEAPLPLPPGSAPNGSGTVNAVASESPEFLARSAFTFEFLDEVVKRLQAEDPNWGYNGKRGDPNNISLDAIAYRTDPANLRNVHIFDIIGGHGGPNPQPAWQDVTVETYNCGTTGMYVPTRPNNSAPVEDNSDVI